MNHNFYSNFVMLTQGGLQIAWKYTTSTLLVHEKSLSRLAARQQLSRASCWTSADRNVRNIICLSLSCLADCGHSRPGRTEIRQIYQILVFCTFWYSESKDTKHLIWKKVTELASFCPSQKSLADDASIPQCDVTKTSMIQLKSYGFFVLYKYS